MWLSVASVVTCHLTAVPRHARHKTQTHTHWVDNLTLNHITAHSDTLSLCGTSLCKHQVSHNSSCWLPCLRKLIKVCNIVMQPALSPQLLLSIFTLLFASCVPFFLSPGATLQLSCTKSIQIHCSATLPQLLLLISARLCLFPASQQLSTSLFATDYLCSCFLSFWFCFLCFQVQVMLFYF